MKRHKGVLWLAGVAAAVFAAVLVMSSDPPAGLGPTDWPAGHLSQARPFRPVGPESEPARGAGTAGDPRGRASEPAEGLEPPGRQAAETAAPLQAPPAVPPDWRPEDNLRYPFHQLDWRAGSSLPVTEDMSANTVEILRTDGTWSAIPSRQLRDELSRVGQELPPNTVRLRVSAYDALTEGVWTDAEIAPIQVHVLDEQRRLRAAGTVASKEAPWSKYLRFDCVEDANFLVRVSAGDKVGYGVFGTGVRGHRDSQESYGGWAREYLDGRHFDLHLLVALASDVDRAAHGSEIRVVDSHGNAIQTAMAYCGRQVVGQADSLGRMQVLCARSEPMASSTVAIHAPGKVPVFIPCAEFLERKVSEVVLHGNEYAVKFRLPLSDSTPAGDTAHSRMYSGPDRGVVPNDVADVREALEKRHWSHIDWSYYRASSTSHHTELEAVVKRAPFDILPYRVWYSGQWRYNKDTCEWTVVIPHPGRYVIAIHWEKRPGLEHDGRGLHLYPGLYLDARDPSNPHAELIYAP